MNAPTDPHRPHLRATLEAYFRRRSFPRAFLSLALMGAGAGGFLASVLMLRAGEARMWVRYPVAALVGYALLLAIIRLWAEWERRRFDPNDPEVRSAAEQTRFGAPEHGAVRRSGSRWWEFVDVGSAGDSECGAGCVVLGAALGLVLLLVSVVGAAPALAAEVFLDAFIVAALAKHLNTAARGHWLSTALRRTWWRALLTALLLGVGGWALGEMAPGAHSIGQALRQIFRW